MNHRRAKRIPVLLLILLAVAALLGLCLWQFRFRPANIRHSGSMLRIMLTVPKSRHEPEAFVRDPATGRMSYATEEGTALTGIDVSHHQQEIDWEAVAADGIDFAMIRLGYRGYDTGLLNPDRYFEQNMAGAKAAGLKVGVYFYSQALTPEEAEEEADFVLDTLDGRLLDYPVVFDWETTHPELEPRTLGLSGDGMTRCAQAFVDRIREGGYQPMVYFNPRMGYLDYDLGALAHVPYWLARYEDTPDFYFDYDLWQYSHTGTVAGIEGSVDLNLDLRPAKKK